MSCHNSSVIPLGNLLNYLAVTLPLNPPLIPSLLPENPSPFWTPPHPMPLISLTPNKMQNLFYHFYSHGFNSSLHPKRKNIPFIYKAHVSPTRNERSAIQPLNTVQNMQRNQSSISTWDFHIYNYRISSYKILLRINASLIYMLGVR